MSHPYHDQTGVQEIQSLLAGLTERIHAIEQHLGIDSEKPAEPSPTPKDAIVFATLKETPVAIESALPSDGTASLSTANAKTGTTRSDPVHRINPPMNAESLESMIGGKLFTWVGGILLVLATAFFAVWSWRNLNLPSWSRVAMMHSVGLVAIIAASWFRGRSLKVHSRALYGVGIFALYASALAMTHLYKLGGDMHELLGFADGVLITGLAIFLSLRDRSVGIILLGALGGYLTPLLTFQTNGDPNIVFSYLAMLNVALVVSGYFGKWEFLKPLAWTATILSFGLAFLTQGFDSQIDANVLLSLHALIFVASTTLPHLIWKTASDHAGNVILFMNSLVYFMALHLVNFDNPTFQMIFGFVMAAIHAAIMFSAFERLDLTDRIARICMALASLFLTVGLTLAFREQPDFWATLWAIEALVLGLIGMSFRDRQMIATSTIIFALSIVRALLADMGQASSVLPSPIALRWLLYSGLTSIVGSAYWWMPLTGSAGASKTEWMAKLNGEFKIVGRAFLMTGNVLLMAAVAFQFEGQPIWILLAGTINAAAIWLIGFKLNQLATRTYAAIFASAVVMLVGALLVQRFAEIHMYWDWNSRIVFAITSLTLVIAGWVYWRNQQQSQLSTDEHIWHSIFTTAGHVVLLAFVTAELILIFDSSEPGNTVEMATWSVTWGVYAAVLVTIGFSLRYRLYRYLGIALFSVVLLKVFLIDLSQFELIIRVFALLCLGLLMLGVSLLYQKFKARLEND